MAPKKRRITSLSLSSDEDSGDNYSDDEVAAGKQTKRAIQSSSKPKKKGRTAKLSSFLNMPQDIFFEICSHLDLQTLYSLYNVNRQFALVLGHRSLRPLWETARITSDLPNLLAPNGNGTAYDAVEGSDSIAPKVTQETEDWIELLQYADLMFGRYCTTPGCLTIPTKKDRTIDYLFRVRLCSNCAEEQILFQEELTGEEKWVVYSDYCLQSSEDQFGREKKRYHCFRSNVDAATKRSAELDKMATLERELEVQKFSRKTSEFIDDRETDLQAILEWNKTQALVKETEKVFIRLERRALIERKFMSLGFSEQLFEDPEWVVHKLLNLAVPLTDSIWRKIQPTLSALLDKIFISQAEGRELDRLAIKQAKREQAEKKRKEQILKVTYLQWTRGESPKAPPLIGIHPLPDPEEFLDLETVNAIWGFELKEGEDEPSWMLGVRGESGGNVEDPLEGKYEAIVEELEEMRRTLEADLWQIVKEGFEELVKSYEKHSYAAQGNDKKENEVEVAFLKAAFGISGSAQDVLETEGRLSPLEGTTEMDVLDVETPDGSSPQTNTSDESSPSVPAPSPIFDFTSSVYDLSTSPATLIFCQRCQGRFSITSVSGHLCKRPHEDAKRPSFSSSCYLASQLGIRVALHLIDFMRSESEKEGTQVDWKLVEELCNPFNCEECEQGKYGWDFTSRCRTTPFIMSHVQKHLRYNPKLEIPKFSMFLTKEQIANRLVQMSIAYEG